MSLLIQCLLDIDTSLVKVGNNDRSLFVMKVRADGRGNCFGSLSADWKRADDHYLITVTLGRDIDRRRALMLLAKFFPDSDAGDLLSEEEIEAFLRVKVPSTYDRDYVTKALKAIAQVVIIT